VRYRYVVVLHVNSALGGSFALGQTSRGVPVGVFAGHEGGILLATRSANVGSGGMEDRGVREAHLGGHFLGSCKTCWEGAGCRSAEWVFALLAACWIHRSTVAARGR